MPRILLDAEIWRRKQLLQQDDLRAARVRRAHQALGAIQVRGRSQLQANCVAATVTRAG